MKNISVALFMVVALIIFGCSDNCHSEPLNAEELTNLFNY